MLHISSGKKTRPKPTKKELFTGLKALNGLWTKGLLPWDLRKHFLLTWFAFANGNLIKASAFIGLDRCQILNQFIEEGVGGKTFKLRKIWAGIRSKDPQKDFNSSFFLFYRRIIKIPVYTPLENKDLIRLWLLGFPEQALRPHYVLWAFRQGLTRNEVCQRFGFTYRTLYRIRRSSIQKGSLANTWLFPLKPIRKEWYPGRSSVHGSHKSSTD
jgi:hypothetical protein